MGKGVLLGLVSSAIVVTALGPATAAEAVKPRFTLDSARDGFVRLDTQTGAATHCSVVKGTWTCDAILAGDTGLGPRLDALALEVARLATETAALEAKIGKLTKAGGSAPAAVPPTAAPPVAQSSLPPAETNVARRIVGRFLVMVRWLKHGRHAAEPAATPS